MGLGDVDVDAIREFWDKLRVQKNENENNTTRLMEVGSLPQLASALILTRLQELIDELAKISHAYETERLDRDRDVDFTRRIQRENNKLKVQLTEYQKKCDRDSTVLVLIDGDGLLFEDRYVQTGEKGGINAASEFLDHITNYVRMNEAIPSDAKVVVRIFANLQGLTRTYEQADIADSETVIDFARGFTMARALFDFVDCGSGKERADSKIRASFNLGLNSLQCRHIILGCSHDNGYARMLEEVHSDDYEKITLLEGVPFTRELSALAHKFGSTQCRSLFRDTKIETYGNYHKRTQANGYHVSPVMSSATTRETPPAKGNGLYQSPYETHRSNSSDGDPAFTPASTVSSAAPPSSSSAANWAGTAKAAAALPAPAANLKPAVNSAATESPIRRNRKGQRIDPPKPKELDMQLLQKVQSMKLCNNFFLKGFCHNANSTCEHDHYYKPSPKELAVLKYIARRIPCVRGTTCDDPKCTAGHRCAFMESGECRFQIQGTCKFGKDMHHSDVTEVKMAIVR